MEPVSRGSWLRRGRTDGRRDLEGLGGTRGKVEVAPNVG